MTPHYFFLLVCFIFMTYLHHRRLKKYNALEKTCENLEGGLKVLMSTVDRYKTERDEAKNLLIECYPLVYAAGTEALADKLAIFIYSENEHTTN